MTSTPLFSIIIPIFNRSETLERSLQSVLKQSCQDFEVWVIDDGSEPQEAEQIQSAVERIADSRIGLVRHPCNRNGAAARNTGIRQARGQYVCFLDSDDEWLEEKLAQVKEAIEEYTPSPQPLLIHHQYVNVDVGRRGLPLPARGMQSGESVAHYSFVTNDVGGMQSSTICVTAQLANANRFNESLRGHQDWDFCLRVGAAGVRILFLPNVLTLRHREPGDSVAKGLDWCYSLDFYSEYQDYFDFRSSAYYFARVVLRKALLSESLAAAMRTSLFYRSLFVMPGPILISICRHGWGQWKLRRRVAKFYRWCRVRRVKSLVVWGGNSYGKAIIEAKPTHCEIDLILDASATEENNCFMNISMMSIGTIAPDRLKEIDAIVMATDRHQQAMCEELKRIDQTLLAKVVSF